MSTQNQTDVNNKVVNEVHSTASNATAGKTAEQPVVELKKEPDLVDLFSDNAEDGGAVSIIDGIDLSAEQIAKIASIHLYDNLYVVATDKQKMLQAHAKIEKNVPGKHRKGIKRTKSSIQAWTKACAVATAITGETYSSSADTLNDPQKTASRMAGFVRDYLKFKKNAAMYTDKNSNAYKLAAQMGLVKVQA